MQNHQLNETASDCCKVQGRAVAWLLVVSCYARCIRGLGCLRALVASGESLN